MLQIIEQQNPDIVQQIRQVRGRLTPRDDIFRPLAGWLATLGTLERPLSLDDWEGVAELTFWSSRLGTSDPLVWDPADLPAESISIEVLSQLCLALTEAKPEKGAALMQHYGEQLVTRFREDTDTLFLTEDDESITAEFIVPFDFLASEPKKRQETETPTSGLTPDSEETATPQGLDSRLNDEAVGRAQLLRGLFPRKSKYCTQGIGHTINFGGIELPHDSTSKRMPPTALPVRWLVRINSTLHSLEIYRRRPSTWKQYAERLLDVREIVASVLLHLQRALTAYFEGSTPKSLFGGKLTLEAWDHARAVAGSKLYLPMSAVDEWGLSSETQAGGFGKEEGFSANIASGFSLRRHQPFLKAVQDYFFAVSNFFNQAHIIGSSHGFTGRNLRTRDEVLALARTMGYDEAEIRLSKHNLFQGMESLAAMQSAFERRLGHLVDPRRLAQVTKRERILFPELWALWYQFCHHPEKRLQAAGVQSLSAMESSLAAIRSALRDGLISETWRAVVVREDFEWEGRPALVLLLDLSSTGNLEDARDNIIAHLVEILRRAIPGSLERYSLDYQWRHILIIPALEGLALDAAAWIVPCFLLSGKEDQERSDSPSLRILQPLPVEQVQQLGLQVNSASTTKSFKEVIERLSGIQYHFTHLALFAEQIPYLDEIGHRVLERYLGKTGQQLKERFDGLLEMMLEATQKARHLDRLAQDELDVLLGPVNRLIEEIGSARGQKVIVNLEDCDAKAEQFQEIVQAVVILQAIMLAEVLDAEAADSTIIEPSQD